MTTIIFIAGKTRHYSLTVYYNIADNPNVATTFTHEQLDYYE